MKILVTGAAGFIAGYLISELLDAGHQVVGLDNLSKYGDITNRTRDIRVTSLCRGKRRTRAARILARGLRSFRRRGRHDRRNLLFPCVCL